MKDLNLDLLILGIRKTSDTIENLGIKKSFDKALKSKIILFLIDTTQEIENQIIELNKIKEIHSKKIIVVINKTDLNPMISIGEETISISHKKWKRNRKSKRKIN